MKQRKHYPKDWMETFFGDLVLVAMFAAAVGLWLLFGPK